MPVGSDSMDDPENSSNNAGEARDEEALPEDAARTLEIVSAAVGTVIVILAIFWWITASH